MIGRTYTKKYKKIYFFGKLFDIFWKKSKDLNVSLTRFIKV